MEKRKTYNWVKFSPDIINKAFAEFKKYLPKLKSVPSTKILIIDKGSEQWEYDDENEFFADYRSSFSHAHYYHYFSGGSLNLWIFLSSKPPYTIVSVSLPKRPEIESVFSIFEDALPICQIPKPTPSPKEPWESKVRIFIGHGGRPLWHDLKMHLEDLHGFKVEAYEVGSRAGLTIKEILEKMLTDSSFAILVLTGEVEDVEGKIHARDNVIHELGLFQGRLGFERAIILLEEDVSEFSNIFGVHQIRFKKDSIRETFGDVIAAIRREFSEDSN